MITIIKDPPDGVLGASASGGVSADDYRRVLVPAIEAELASHMRAFERVALVTDVDWITAVTWLAH